MPETTFSDELAVAIQTDLMKILATMATKDDFREIRGEIAEIKSTIVDMQGDISSIQGDIVSMKGDISSTRSTVSSMHGKMSDMDSAMATKADLDKLYEKLVTEINHGERAVKTDQRLLRLERHAFG